MHSDGSSLLAAQRLSFRAPALMTSPSGHSPGVPPPRTSVGFLLLDSSLRPAAFNAEAIRILSYPNQLADVKHPDVFLAGKIRAGLLTQPPSRESPVVTEFRSGRRRYLCRAFLVDSDGKRPFEPGIAVLLERAPSGSIPLLPISEQFNLTRRERDALAYLLQGLSNKEIANQMNVSPNTVKVFLRLIMLKMEVSSRSAVVAKIMMIKPQRLTLSGEPA
jgi:DNA-binding CsgD family transcriptional regulator